MASWKELREQRGENIAENKRKLRKEEDGCVIRALESITGQQATEAEWDLRFSQIDSVPKLNQVILSAAAKGQDIISVFERLIKKEEINILNFALQIAKTETPMGKTLAGMSIMQARCTPEQITQAIHDGSQVILIGFIRENDQIASHTNLHAAHLGLENNNFISLSDNGQMIKINHMATVLIFTK